MARVFISYKRADKDMVLPLKNRIEKAIGEPCWMDMDGIASDAQFVDVIIGAIDKASILVFMYSKRHAEMTDYTTDWTIRELNYAHQKGKRIVFVNIDQTPLDKWFAFMFPQHQMIDASSPMALSRLMNDMRVWLAEGENNTESNHTRYTEGLDYFYYPIFGKHAMLNGIGTSADSDIVVPPVITMDGRDYTVTKISPCAFSDCYQLKSIILPDTITTIGSTAFSNCHQLRSIILPNTITSIGSMAFSGCHQLRSIILPDTITSIGRMAFSDCHQLRSVILPDTITTIGSMAFSGCANLKSINIPKSLKKVKAFAFSDCDQLQLPTFPPTVSVSRWVKGFNFLTD